MAPCTQGNQTTVERLVWGEEGTHSMFSVLRKGLCSVQGEGGNLESFYCMRQGHPHTSNSMVGEWRIPPSLCALLSMGRGRETLVLLYMRKGVSLYSQLHIGGGVIPTPLPHALLSVGRGREQKALALCGAGFSMGTWLCARGVIPPRPIDSPIVHLLSWSDFL